MAAFYTIDNLSSYSGGTEATAMFPKVAETLTNQGFKIVAISKLVLGSDKRIPITYEDPKKSDGTPQQSETYLERSLQIATEMKFVFSSLS